jgi:uncharacterized membrane protein YeaQ/YmgE (transglycosylase-associated protein family)
MDIIVDALIGGFLMQAFGVAGSGGLLYTILVALVAQLCLPWFFGCSRTTR